MQVRRQRQPDLQDRTCGTVFPTTSLNRRRPLVYEVITYYMQENEHGRLPRLQHEQQRPRRVQRGPSAHLESEPPAPRQERHYRPHRLRPLAGRKKALAAGGMAPHLSTLQLHGLLLAGGTGGAAGRTRGGPAQKVERKGTPAGRRSHSRHRRIRRLGRHAGLPDDQALDHVRRKEERQLDHHQRRRQNGAQESHRQLDHLATDPTRRRRNR